MHYSKSRGEKTADVIIHIVIIIFLLGCLYPIINILALAFNNGDDSLKGGIFLWPRKPTLGNFYMVFRLSSMASAYFVTIARTVVGTIVAISVAAVAAYPLSIRGLPGKKIVTVYFVITMFFSGGLIPQYLVMKNTGLINTFWVYIIPGCFGFMTAVIMKTAFQNVPDSLKEAIRIDGGSEFTVFIKAVIPLSASTIAALSLFCAVGHWNDWWAGSYLVTSQRLVPVQSYLMALMNQSISSQIDMNQTSGYFSQQMQYVTSMSVKLAGVVLATAPIIILYPFLQKYFTKGVLIGSIKG